MERRSLAVCAVFRNEAPYLLEWIAYHRAIGFDRFVLYDNGSRDGGADLVRSSPLAERVTVIHWPQRPGQMSAYRHFIDIFAPAYDWAAFIDIDEFILPLQGQSLPDVLQRCGQASALLANWLVFGPAGHEEPPAGLVIENYDLRSEDSLPVNRHVKSIVRCADLLDAGPTPHVFRLKGVACNPLGQEVPNEGLQAAACHQGLVINRYHTRSRQDWLRKAQGGDRLTDAEGWTEEVFDHLASVCRVKDETIKAYAAQVRSMLGPHAPGAASAAERHAPHAPAMQSAAAAPAGERPAFPPAGPAFPAMPEGQPALAIPAGAAPVPPIIPPQPQPVAAWRASGTDAQERLDGLALIFRDRSRPAASWFAALRGEAAGAIDPDFLLDEAGRLREFPTDREARAACEAVLADAQLA